MIVDTINLTGNGVSVAARSGISYAPMPVTTQAQKDGALAASQALISSGVTAADLGNYVPRGSFFHV
eukprot:11158183-Alexandrium_andersonii.AAC.1